MIGTPAPAASGARDALLPRRVVRASVALTVAGATAGALAAAWLTRRAGATPPEGGRMPVDAAAPLPPPVLPQGAPRARERTACDVRPSAAHALTPREAVARLRTAEGLVFDEMGLSSQERCIARLIMQGLTYREIAERVCLVERTVKYHASRLYAKARVDNRRGFEAYVRQAMAGDAARPEGFPTARR
ncbi:MAG: helix-turn-helix transcriptional regulator [Eggerthellaceae bacterium]|nr:helix-turn-helix transcriptional regulator [Eggerthellaceae bacterium]